jgi:hypothetical protein
VIYRKTCWCSYGRKGVSLRLMELLFARHLDRILETLILYLRSARASFVAIYDLAAVRLKQAQHEYVLSFLKGNEGFAGRRLL